MNAHIYGQWTWCGKRPCSHRATQHTFLLNITVFKKSIKIIIMKLNLIKQNNYYGKHTFFFNSFFPILTMKFTVYHGHHTISSVILVFTSILFTFSVVVSTEQQFVKGIEQGWVTSQANSLILFKKTIFSQNHQIKSVL